MFHFYSPKINPGDKVIDSENNITGGALHINDAYDLSLVQLSNGNFELRLFMKLQFFFTDSGMHKWSTQDKQNFIANWENRVRTIWDGHNLKTLSNNKSVHLKLEFKTQIGGFMFDHWEITVKKAPPGTTFRSYVRPGKKDVTLTENDNGITVRKLRSGGSYQQITSTHEFGHMIGLDDEYGPLFGGNQGPFNNEYNSIMNIGSKVKKRHTIDLLNWLNRILTKHNIK